MMGMKTPRELVPGCNLVFGEGMIEVEVTAWGWWWWTHAAATWALMGLIWMVQGVVYPLMARQDAGGWVAWHRDYTRRMGRVVGPLMLVELGGAVAWGWQDPANGWAWVALALVGLNWLSTVLVQVPLHRRLAQGFDAHLIRRLVITNWVRTALWTGRGGLLLSCAMA